ncbi:AI-2E family transporter [Mucilaginibacter sp. P25]|uniref:Predicted PurR-regulated permease PerM n=1 Tax=Mucilaginibacter gossypii TaxID=551996 RepID=A0A1G8ILB1_9SPHI|nr:AI-2E family transporter [Mucilaginibacter gossypii]SDI19581.1 Predicted PurR-regulated permease PerM [Mucilaginibacter gossypii]
MPAVKEYPFYLKSTVILFGLILLVYVFAQLADVMIPLAFSAFIAILLNPVSNWLQEHKAPKILSICLAMLLGAILLTGLFYFLSTQIIQFGDSLPTLKKKFGEMFVTFKDWVAATFNYSVQKQDKLIKDAMDNSQALVGRTLGNVLSTFGLIFVVPVYVFLVLFYKTLLLNFIYEVFSEENSKQVADVLKETKSAIQSYIQGLLIEMVIVAAMNSLALILLGVKYGILIGVIGAILNLLPYLGGIIAISLPVLMATVTKDGYTTQLGVIIAYLVIQFIDNNILVPRIVSSKVQINALISIVVVLLGNLLWGLSGMFLSIPFVAVLKIIFDRIDTLKPWGKLLGDTIPTRPKGAGWTKTRKKAVLPEDEVKGKS